MNLEWKGISIRVPIVIVPVVSVSFDATVPMRTGPRLHIISDDLLLLSTEPLSESSGFDELGEIDD